VFASGQGGVVAYDAATGTQLWAAAYRPHWDRDYQPLAASPDGSTVFVTGTVPGTPATITTIAYNASTGARVWISRDTGLRGAGASARQITVSPDGSTVYILGETTGGNGSSAYLVVACSAAAGARLWEAHYNARAGTESYSGGLAVIPAGVVLTGATQIPPLGYDRYYFATVAFHP
jgi:outer membrane protein assembly factor BamB